MKQQTNIILDTHKCIKQHYETNYPHELITAFDKYNTNNIDFNKWIKNVRKYTTYCHNKGTIDYYYTVKDNIIAKVERKTY